MKNWQIKSQFSPHEGSLKTNRIYAAIHNFCELWLLYLVLAGFILGVVIAGVFMLPASFLLPIIIFAVVVFLLALVLRRFNLLIIAALLLGLFWCSADLANLDSFDVPVGRTAVLEGKVIEVITPKSDYMSNILEVDTAEAQSSQAFILKTDVTGQWQGKVLLYNTGPTVKEGDHLLVKALVMPEKSNSNPGLVSGDYNRKQGISATLKIAPGGIKFLELEQKSKLFLAAQGIKGRLYQAMEPLPERQQIFIKGIAFGDKAGLSGYQQQVLSQTGVMHVFAVSGTHMVYVVLFATLLANLLGKLLHLKKKFKFGFVIISTLFYAMITGFSPSVLRSFIMSSAAAFTLLSGKSSNKGVIVISAFICLFWQPLWIFDLGFQLSFLASAGIIFTKRIWSYITKIQALQVTCAAQFLITPLIAYNFNIMNIVGFIFSPIVTLGSGLVIILVLIAMVLALFGLADLPLYGAGLLSELMYVVAEKLSFLPGSWLAMVKPSLFVVILYFILLFVGYWLINKGAKQLKNQADTPNKGGA